MCTGDKHIHVNGTLWSPPSDTYILCTALLSCGVGAGTAADSCFFRFSISCVRAFFSTSSLERVDFDAITKKKEYLLHHTPLTTNLTTPPLTTHTSTYHLATPPLTILPYLHLPPLPHLHLPLPLSGLSLRALQQVYVNPTKGKWTVRAVTLAGPWVSPCTQTGTDIQWTGD